jgi:hypothetical protein
MISNVFTVTALYFCVLAVVIATIAPKVEAGPLRIQRQNTTIDGDLASVGQVVGPFGKTEMITLDLLVHDEKDQIIMENEVRVWDRFSVAFSTNSFLTQ